MSSILLHTTPTHTPSHSRSPSDYVAHRPRRDASFSPCRTTSATPPRKTFVTTSYDSPMLMLTPSPLRRRIDVDHDSSMQLDGPEDLFASTPLKHPAEPMFKTPEVLCSVRRQHKPSDDDEGIFLGSSSSSLRLSDPHAMHHMSSNTSTSNTLFPHATKRKVNLLSSTPHHNRVLTPIRINHAPDASGDKQIFASLAPLPAPRFLRTPVDTDNSLKRQAESLHHLRLADKSIDLDSSSEEEQHSRVVNRGKNRHVLAPKITKEVVESISPGGHIIKRRVRSRPVSQELLDSPSPPANLVLPVHSRGHSRNNSNSSNRDTESPKKTGAASRPEFDRIVSSGTLFFGPAIPTSTAPATSSTQAMRPKLVTRTSTLTAPPGTPSPRTSPCDEGQDPFSTISPNTSFTSAFAGPVDTSFTFSLTEGSPQSRTSSPRGQIPKKYKKPRDSGVVLSDDDADDFLQPILPQPGCPSVTFEHQAHARASTHPSSSTSFNSFSSESTLFDDSFVTPGFGPSASSAWPGMLNVSAQESVDEFIVKTLTAGGKEAVATGPRMPNTPQKRTKTAFLGVGVGPGQRPWASAMTSKIAHLPLFPDKLSGPQFLGGNSKPRKSCPGDLRFPSVEQHQAHHRTDSQNEPASAKSAGSSSESENSPSNTRAGGSRGRTYGDVGLGRPSNAARLSADEGRAQLLIRRSSSGAFSSSSESSSGTPTKAKGHDWRLPVLPMRPQYTPSNNTLQLSPISSNPSSMLNSPTGPRHPVRSQLPISGKKSNPSTIAHHRHSSSVASVTPMRKTPGYFSSVSGLSSQNSARTKHRDVRGIFWNHHLMPPRGEHEQPGRFERDFVEVDEIGAGEFGRAMKVRYKHGRGGAVFAIKKSKRFEGLRHRTRLREEVDVLMHLCRAAGTSVHPNVLGYVDSWEQDETLYILTELCDYGNFAHFLGEYGHHFARLDEARVWKVFADLSNGLRFIHNAGVIHLDLKPANIFITVAGQFKIGDFGMASVWPRQVASADGGDGQGGFEREGDKMYLAAEVLQGRYGKETDIFSFGMTMLETAANIMVPTQGELWHKLRDEDFGPVEGFEEECSGQLIGLIKSMMRKDPARRPDIEAIWGHPVVARARGKMEEVLAGVRAGGESSAEALFQASPLAGVEACFLSDILGRGHEAMDWS